MAMYVDARLIVDTQCLLTVNACEGDGPHDGKCGLHVLLAGGKKPIAFYVEYPSQEARDAALTALGVLVQQDEAQARDGQGWDA